MSTIKINFTQNMFIDWNAERLGDTRQEAERRFVRSWECMPHDGLNFRQLITNVHDVMTVFCDDRKAEVHDAYITHQYLHMLRFMSYNMPPLMPAMEGGKGTVTIVDYGCGMAMLSVDYAIKLKEKGIDVLLVLVDIKTVMTDFLAWEMDKLGIRYEFIAIENEDHYPVIPPSDICIVLETWEHVYNPLLLLENVNNSIRPGGWLVSFVDDRQTEMFHVSPDLSKMRKRFSEMGYSSQKGDYFYRGDMYFQKPMV